MNKQQEPRLRFKGFTEEWKNKTLGDLGRVEMCRRIFKEQTQPSGEIPFFKIGTFGQEPDAFISSELFEEYRQKYPYPKQGDILISAAGTIGRTVKFTGENAYFQDSNIVWLRFDESQITSTFLNITYQNIKWDLEGSTIKRLYNSDLLSAEITVPSLPEQTHLGLFFSRLDSQIAESRAVLEKSRQLKKAMLAKMFPANGEKIPKIRFKGFEGEWKREILKDVVNVFDNLRIPVSENKRTSGNTPYFGANGIQDYVDGFTHNGEFVLIAEDGANDLKNYPVQYVNGKCWVNNHAHVLQGKSEILNNIFLFSRFQSMDISQFLVGGGRAKLNGSTMLEIEIEFPKDKKEQTAIGLFFRQLDETIALQTAEVEKLNQLKKGLLAAMLV